MARIMVKTYGCTMNRFESEIIQGMLEQDGHEFQSTIQDVNLIILNTCMVKSPTENKILSMIRDLVKKHPDKKLLLAGCMPEIIPEKLQAMATNASLIGTHALSNIRDVVKEVLMGQTITRIHQPKKIKLGLPISRKNPLIGIVPIEEGCQGSCSFCCTRFAKGSIVSYPLNQIIEEARLALQKGCKEIWLTGQDTGAYSNDSQKLPDVLQGILTLPFEFHIRIGMMNPKSCLAIVPSLLEAYEPIQTYKFLHLPLQAGNDEILASMNRDYSIQEFRQIIRKFREKFPRLTLATDVIVGFPGETSEQFNDTLQMLEQINPDIVNISKFGGRPGTLAKKMSNQIPSGEVKRRSQVCSALVEQLTKKRNESWINWEGPVLITKKGKENTWIGRNFAYKSVIINTNDNLLGATVNVLIDKIGKSHLIGIQK